MHDDERESTRAFLCTRSNIFNSRKLNFVHYIFILQFLLSLVLQFSPELQQVEFDVDFHTFISFPSSTELFEALYDERREKEHENVQQFASSSAFKFSCQNSVFIMLLLLEPDACSTPKHVTVYHVLSGAFFFGMVNGKKSFLRFTTQNIKFMSYLMGVGWL